MKQKIIAHLKWAGTSAVGDIAKATGATNKEIVEAVNAEPRLMWIGGLVGFVRQAGNFRQHPTANPKELTNV